MTRLPGVMTDVLPSRDDAQLFRRAKRLGFAGVEVILKRAEGDRLEGLRRAQADDGTRRSEPRARRALGRRRRRRRRSRRRSGRLGGRRACARLGIRARERRAARAVLRPGGAAGRGRRRPGGGRAPSALHPSRRARCVAALRRHAYLGRDPRRRRGRRFAGIRLLFRHGQRRHAGDGHRHRAPWPRRPGETGAREGRPREGRRPSAGARPRRLCRDGAGAGRDRLRRLDRAGDAAGPARARRP